MSKIFETIQDSNLEKPVVLTIGNFDGVHKGHQALFHRVTALAREMGESSAAITFKQHPRAILDADKYLPKISSLEHKLMLLSEYGIENIFTLEFTREFSEQSPREFLTQLMRYIPFNNLVLGYDARFGKGREGDETVVKELAKELNFNVEYVPPFKIGDKIISSSVIRQAINEGNFQLLERYLGRPYSIYARVESGAGRGHEIGYPTANLKVDYLALPPHGVYVVKVIKEGESFYGVANLGYAPTVRQGKELLLEVHLLNHSSNLYGQFIEVCFVQYLRPEYKFASIEALTAQIGRDVQQAHQIVDRKDNNLDFGTYSLITVKP